MRRLSDEHLAQLRSAAFTILRQVNPSADENLFHPDLQDTPSRFAKAWEEMTGGYGIDPASLITRFEAADHDEMVFVQSIPFYSTCEHHLLPFHGVAHVAYIPNGSIIGLSKIPRLVDLFARRISVQERITNEIADALDSSSLAPKGVGVVLQARHMCMEMRGIRTAGATTQTNALRGRIKIEPEARAEFFSMVPKIGG